ncbi:MAG: hypothetical protein J6L24_04510 [Oscillospiraceae bacterium]|nr:hypothetical protein [Oscillospiraceae bacterium]
MFKRKYEFKPDKDRSGTLSKLYVTKKQRLTLLKWLLMTFVLVVISVVQDVILSQIPIFGTRIDLLACAILLACVLQDPEVGCVFALVSSALYWFSGSAPGPYVVALLTALGVVVSIFRHSYLRYSFVSILTCTAAAVMVYELLTFAIGFFLGRTTLSRLAGFCLSGGLSLAVMPLLYPVFVAIGKIGGETWKE